MVSVERLDLMKLKMIKALSLLMITLTLGCKSTVNTFGVKFEAQLHSLSNGLTVIFVEDHTVPVISYQTFVRAGSVDEEPGKTGIAHLFEHLMFKGTEKYGSKEFFKKLETRGASVNAYTTRDYTVYHETFIPPLLDTVIELESDRLANLKVTQKALDIEKQIVFEERRLRTENSPSGKMNEALWNSAFRLHPYQNPIIGYPLDLARLTAEDLNDFFKTYYIASNIALVVVGDFEPNEVLKKIKKAYGELPEQKPPERKIVAEPNRESETRLQLYDHVASDRLMIAYPIVSAFDDEAYSLDVLANILFEGTHSRGQLSLVESEGFFLSLGGSAFTPTFPGLFLIQGTLAKGFSAEHGESKIYHLLSQIQTEGVTQSEVKKAVRQLSLEIVDTVRTPYGLAQLIGTAQMVLGDAKRFSKDLEKYHEVTPEKVKKVATKYFDPNNRTVVIMSPESYRDRIRKNKKKSKSVNRKVNQ